MKTHQHCSRFCAFLLLLISFVPSVSAQDNYSGNRTSRIMGADSYSGGLFPVRKHVNQYRNCSAMAPADWMITSSRREGDALDICSGDGNLYAGYLVLGVQGSLATGFYRYMYATPETFLNYSISENGSKAVRYGEPVTDQLGYTILPFEVEGAPAVEGVVFYRVWPVPGDPYGYVLTMRMAKTLKQLWKTRGAQAISVALSIRSVVQLQPGGTNSPGNIEDKKVESGYNRQLGMEYAHDPDTGENYWVSPGTDYQETGLYGPGYYKTSGNDTKKLLPGRSDD